MLDRARVVSDDIIVVVGTGASVLICDALRRIGGDGAVIAVSDSVDDLDALRARCPDPRISFLVGNADVVPLPDASVDVVVGRSVLEQALGGTEQAIELARVLRTGGRVSLFEPVGAATMKAPLTGAGFTAIDVAQGVFLAGRKA